MTYFKKLLVGSLLVLSPLVVAATVMPDHRAAKNHFCHGLPDYYSSCPTGHFDFRQYGEYAAWPMELAHLLQHHEANGQTNNVCLIGYRFPDGRKEIIVHWPQGPLLIRWHGGWSAASALADIQYAASMTFEHDRYHLVEDVIEERPEHGSTYKALRSGIDALIADCKRHGIYYTIAPFKTVLPGRAYHIWDQHGLMPVSTQQKQRFDIRCITGCNMPAEVMPHTRPI